MNFQNKATFLCEVLLKGQVDIDFALNACRDPADVYLDRNTAGGILCQPKNWAQGVPIPSWSQAV